MAATKNRALVVDDELTIVRLICRELLALGIECDAAADGDEALKMLKDTSYDLVVTDLKMPQMHGHALAHDILRHDKHPLIVVHTGVIDPRLAKDLLRLGVDDIVFKPVDFGFLAEKLKLMVERKSLESEEADISDLRTLAELSEIQSNDDISTLPVGLTKLNAKIAAIARLLPISQTALDVYEMTRSIDWDLSQIAAAVQREASLTAEVLRLANSSTFNPSSQRITNLEDAIRRIGQKRVGELALSASALSILAPGMLPWMDLELAWKRSMAAGIALESLIEIGGHDSIDEGLFLSAILHPLGRVVMGTAFPKYYESMIERCRMTGETLRQQERRVFPIYHAEVMAQLLAGWRVPSDLVQSLRFSMDDFAVTCGFSEPMRTRVELVKVAITIGRLAVGEWEDWNQVQFPHLSTIKRLGLSKLGDIISRTRMDVNKLAEFRPGPIELKHSQCTTPALTPVAYCNFTNESTDLFAAILPSFGLQPASFSDVGSDKPWIANCIGVTPSKQATIRQRKNALVITDQDNYESFNQFCPSISLPCSFGRLRDKITSHLYGSPKEQLLEVVS